MWGFTHLWAMPDLCSVGGCFWHPSPAGRRLRCRMRAGRGGAGRGGGSAASLASIVARSVTAHGADAARRRRRGLVPILPITGGCAERPRQPRAVPAGRGLRAALAGHQRRHRCINHNPQITAAAHGRHSAWLAVQHPERPRPSGVRGQQRFFPGSLTAGDNLVIGGCADVNPR